MNLKNFKRVEDSVTLSKEQEATLKAAYEDSLAGPETSSGVCRINGHVFGMFMECDDYTSYRLLADPDLFDDVFEDELEVVDWNSGVILYSENSDLGDTSDEEVIPEFEVVKKLVEDYL